MAGYLIRNQLKPGLNEIRTANTEAGELLDFYIWRASKGDEAQVETEGKEFGIIIMWGVVEICCGTQELGPLGGRVSVFSGKATGVWVPPGVGISFRALSDCEVALAAAPSDAAGQVAVVRPEEVVTKTVGHWNWTRDVHTVIGDNVPQAKRLVIGETINPPGNWSSYPPHKHTADDYPFEVRMEEIYHFRVRPEQGFGVQVLYNDDLSIDECYTVRDGDTVVIPAAYHPVAAAPGYQVYYLWMLAAYEDRRMCPRDDERHAWVHAAGEMARSMGF